MLSKFNCITKSKIADISDRTDTAAGHDLIAITCRIFWREDKGDGGRLKVASCINRIFLIYRSGVAARPVNCLKWALKGV